MRINALGVVLAIPIAAGYVYAVKHPTQREGPLVMMCGFAVAIVLGVVAAWQDEKRHRPHRVDRWRPRLTPAAAAAPAAHA